MDASITKFFNTPLFSFSCSLTCITSAVVYVIASLSMIVLRDVVGHDISVILFLTQKVS